MFYAMDGNMFVMPLCYHPTTVLSVDDDVDFSNILQLSIDTKMPLLCFNNPEEARNHMKNNHHYLPFSSRCVKEVNEKSVFDLKAIRDELYNKNRFKEIFVSVTDYDMPHISGIELIKSMEFSSEISQYGHIILTGKISDEFKSQIQKLHLADGYIGKDDPDYVEKLVNLADIRSKKIFQLYSYPPARLLSQNTEEKPSILFDGNFVEVFNQYIAENSICEFYLFDKQGSYVFLDENANLSWLIVRNNKGMEHSIQRAQKYGAPQSIIDSLKSDKYILSLYEEEDFQRIKPTEWEDYILPANTFESNANYLGFFTDLVPDDKMDAKYYYAFTDVFPEHGIKREDVLSYKDFIESQM